MSMYRLILAASAAGLIACACGAGGEPNVKNVAGVEGTSAVSTAWPMPPLEVRVQRAVAELGPELNQARAALSGSDASVRRNRRAILVQLGPRARGVLKRHGVQLVHLARYVRGGRS